MPERTGKQLLYAVWQRSDSPEAFYSCSDVDFGAGGTNAAGSPAPTASSPSDEQIAAGADKSTVEHGGHGDDDASTSAEPVAEAAAGTGTATGTGTTLAATGGDGSTPYLAIGGAAALALGSGALFLTVRRRERRH